VLPDARAAQREAVADAQTRDRRSDGPVPRQPGGRRRLGRRIVRLSERANADRDAVAVPQGRRRAVRVREADARGGVPGAGADEANLPGREHPASGGGVRLLPVRRRRQRPGLRTTAGRSGCGSRSRGRTTATSCA
jgi:hypothetical protein